MVFSYPKNKPNNNKKKNLRYSNSTGEFTNIYLGCNNSKEKEIKTNSNKSKINRGIINSVNAVQKKEQKQNNIILK